MPQLNRSCTLMAFVHFAIALKNNVLVYHLFRSRRDYVIISCCYKYNYRQREEININEGQAHYFYSKAKSIFHRAYILILKIPIINNFLIGALLSVYAMRFWIGKFSHSHSLTYLLVIIMVSLFTHPPFHSSKLETSLRRLIYQSRLHQRFSARTNDFISRVPREIYSHGRTF